jgi:hypothetical protein
MVSAIVFIVASQAVLAGLLLATSVLDRPRGLRWHRRPPRDPASTVRAHQQAIAGLRAASERSQL